MAIFNNLGDRGQYNQVLQRRFNMLGAAPAPALMPEIGPTICVENDRPEWEWLKGGAIRSHFYSVGAVAGQFSSVQLYMPLNASAIAVVFNITCISSQGAQIGRTVVGAGAGGWVKSVEPSRDFRDLSTGGSIISETNTIASLVTPTFGRLGQNQAFTAPIVIVGRDQALFVQNTTAAAAFACNISWYEREALPGELV